MEHIPRGQPRSCMVLDSCLYALSMNMFVLPVNIYIATCTGDTRSLIFNSAEREGLYCCSDIAAIVCILLLPLLISSCHHSQLLPANIDQYPILVRERSEYGV